MLKSSKRFIITKENRMKYIKLKDYQQQMVDELEFLPAIGLFSKTGSGKTYTSLYRANQNPTDNLLVICPPNVVKQWQANINHIIKDIEIVKFKKSWTNKRINEELKQYKGKNKIAVVVSLNSIYLLDELLKLVNKNWTVIVDESHKIKSVGTKNNPVKVTKRALEIGKLTPWKIILTATPTQGIKGGWIDLYSQMKFLGYMEDMTVYDFKRKYAVEQSMSLPGFNFPIKKIVNYTKDVEEFKNLVEMVSRSYSPKYTEEEPTHVKIDIDTAVGYKRLTKDRAYKEIAFDNPSAYRIGLKTLAGGRITGMNEFKERITYDDNNKKIEWLKEFLKDNTETVPVIFYQYNVEGDQIEELAKKMKLKYIKLDGKNQNKTDDINNKEYDVVIGQINAMGESIDGLQYKSYISIYYSMPESSVAYRQSLGRINRVGQEVAPVYYYLVMENTIDSAIYKLLMDKVEFSQELIDSIAVEVK